MVRGINEYLDEKQERYLPDKGNYNKECNWKYQHLQISHPFVPTKDENDTDEQNQIDPKSYDRIQPEKNSPEVRYPIEIPKNGEYSNNENRYQVHCIPKDLPDTLPW